jgi:hypothetical protein
MLFQGGVIENLAFVAISDGDSANSEIKYRTNIK